MFVSGKVASQEVGVSGDTLRRWANQGVVRCQRINGTGKRFYHRDDVRKMFGAHSADAAQKAKIAYARVSSAKQKEDLQRQIAALRAAYPQHEIVSDIGSGLNWKRKGLQGVLERALKGVVAEVVVMHKDRLCRFGYELVEFVLQTSGAKLVVHGKSDDHHKSTEQELAEDLLAVVTVFAARKHGSRKYEPRNVLCKRKRSGSDDDTTNDDSQDPDLPNSGAEGDAAAVDGCSPVDLQPHRGRGDARTEPKATTAT